MKYKNVRDEPQIKSYMVFRQNADIKNEDEAIAVIDVVLPCGIMVYAITGDIDTERWVYCGMHDNLETVEEMLDLIY